MGLSTDFFNGIFILSANMHKDINFNTVSSIWIWQFEGMNLFCELEKIYRIRVISVKFSLFLTSFLKDKDTIREVYSDISLIILKYTQMIVFGSMTEAGLGDVRWWKF